ncbi:MAG: MogA/MoaB family molybdenum cofactor biosynthesis protein [Acidobacteriota bacterium]|nr:MogA/MoaB family molybdenum cofactor biosynthesis protein [Acidobacteriota bacterium]
MNTSVERHRRGAEGRKAKCAVLTISDSRTAENDTSGDLLRDRLESAGHQLVARRWVRDEPEEIGAVLTGWLADRAAEVIVTTGGTGVSRRDSTIEVVDRLLDKRLEGFGELFRMLSYAEVGSAAMMSRAVAGLSGEALLFALPGSPAAVQLALDKLVMPELPHLLFERQR